MASRSDRLDAQNQGEILQSAVVLCEGKRDASFIHHFLANRRLSGFQVGFPDPTTSRGFGKDAFEDYLAALRARRGFSRLRHLVVIADNDSDPRQAFQGVQRQIRNAGYPVPKDVGITSGDSPPFTTVLMLPGTGASGNLDTLLLKAALDGTHPLHHCFEPFWQCCKVEELPVGKASKMKLTTVVAASCQNNPSCSLVWVWSEKGNPISLSQACFDFLEDFFRTFQNPLAL